VSGVALARQNNGVGVVGVAPGVAAADVFYWGVCDNMQPGNCDSGDIVDALNWARDFLGPRGVINVSIAGSCNIYKAAAVSGAYNAGHVLVAGVGNNGVNEQLCVAQYSQVLAVAGINPNKTFAIPSPCNPNFPGSSWGSHVDVVAPYQVFTTSLANTYLTVCGTSVSSPGVAGVALLVRARYPTWTNGQVRDRIIFTAENLGIAGWDDHFGYGLVRAHLAVAFDPPTVTPSIVAGKPKLTWNPIPFAAQYHIYRSITPTACPTWELYAATTGTTFTDSSTPVTSFYGYSLPPSQTAVNYFVGAVHSDGTYSTSSAPPALFTVSSNPPC
jgi:subtilisin family serine protease